MGQNPSVANNLRTTTTTNGLQVRAHLVETHYAKGVKISDAQMKALPISRHDTLPNWNYVMDPRNRTTA